MCPISLHSLLENKSFKEVFINKKTCLKNWLKNKKSSMTDSLNKMQGFAVLSLLFK